jgi:cytochrome c556
MRKFAIALSIAAVTATMSLAGPMEDRSAVMKSMGKLGYGALPPIAKGEKPFDAAEVNAAFAEINKIAMTIDIAALFPEGSNTGESTASSKIWEDMAGFTAAMDKFKAESAAAAAANPQDLEAFKTQFGALIGSCNGCHETYRVKKG